MRDFIVQDMDFFSFLFVSVKDENYFWKKELLLANGNSSVILLLYMRLHVHNWNNNKRYK